MYVFDYDDGLQRRRNRRLLISIVFEAARETLQLLARAAYGVICQWTSFILFIVVQVTPFWAIIYLYYTLWPNIFDEVHWLILAIPVLIVTYITRSLFTLALGLFHSFAVRRWGRAYARRIPRWMISEQLQDTTRDLKLSFSNSATFYRGVLWLFRQPQRWRESRNQPPENVCMVCHNLDPDRHCRYTPENGNIQYRDLLSTYRDCAICATLHAAVCRFYPPADTSNAFFYQWKRYQPGDDIILVWNKHKKMITIELKNIVAVWPRMTFYCLGKGLDLPLISSPRAAVDDTRSESTMHRVLSWITECTTDHENCSRNQPHPLPDRVLDLGNSPNSPIKLVETRNELGYYACLSHRWGSKQPLRTLSGNKDAFMAGIHMAALPKTFQEAVTVCRQLSLRYFWVDSLCIVQDSVDEWERQLPKMANIYENAFLTIAATKANGHEEGLHPNGESRTVYLERIPAHEIGHGVSEDVYVRLEYQDKGGIRHWDIQSPDQQHEEEWPLLTRAWVFQERLLSPRMLHFAKRELVWECRTGVFCDCGREHDDKADDLEFRRLVSSKSIKTTNATPLQLRALWYAIVERYSRLMGNLTVESDAFPALAGLASRISGLLEDEYVAGLWRSNMVEGLLWARKNETPDNRPVRPKSWRAPSWSWASITDEISYKHNTTSGWFRPELHEIYAAVEDVECVPTGSQRTGPISSAALTLSGWVSHASVRARHTERRNWYTDELTVQVDCDLVWQHDGHESSLRPDHPEDVVDGETVLCLRLARIDKRDWYLVLVRDTQSPGSFRRWGLYEGADVTWEWTSMESWRRRAEQRYHEEKRV
ncbi:heterokaryon incompatibility protein-domain-containing protein, partial [Thelonectria olida]